MSGVRETLKASLPSPRFWRWKERRERRGEALGRVMRKRDQGSGWRMTSVICEARVSQLARTAGECCCWERILKAGVRGKFVDN